MSSTRSPSLPGPATDPILLLVAHGSSHGTEAADTLERHAKALRRTGGISDVVVAVLRGEPALEAVLAGLAGDREVVVLPVLMTEGALSSDELPRRLTAAGGGTQGLTLLPPLGASPALVDLALRRAEAAVTSAGDGPGDHDLLLIGHGNPGDPRGRATVEAAAARSRVRGAFADVLIAFLEEAPSIPDTLARLSRPTVAVGWFAAAGRHARDDVPTLLATAEDGPGVVWLGALGADPDLPAVILRHVEASLAEPGADVIERSDQS